MVRRIEYKGRNITLTVLPEQGRWGYRIDEGPVRTLEATRGPMEQERLFREAETAARAEVDATDERATRRKA
jgi:hypothetical protein